MDLTAEALARNVNHRCVRPCTPRLAVDRIGTKAGLVPEIDLSLVSLGFARNRGIRLTMPVPNRLRIALAGGL